MDLAGLDWKLILLFVLQEGISFYLGKTDKVQAGSLTELILNLVKSLIKK